MDILRIGNATWSRLLGVLAFCTSLSLAACSTRVQPPELVEARDAYAVTASSPDVTTRSPVALLEANRSLARAEEAFEKKADDEEVAFLSRLAATRSEVAAHDARAQAAAAEITELENELRRSRATLPIATSAAQEQAQAAVPAQVRVVEASPQVAAAPAVVATIPSGITDSGEVELEMEQVAKREFEIRIDQERSEQRALEIQLQRREAEYRILELTLENQQAELRALEFENAHTKAEAVATQAIAKLAEARQRSIELEAELETVRTALAEADAAAVSAAELQAQREADAVEAQERASELELANEAAESRVAELGAAHAASELRATELEARHAAEFEAASRVWTQREAAIREGIHASGEPDSALPAEEVAPTAEAVNATEPVAAASSTAPSPDARSEAPRAAVPTAAIHTLKDENARSEALVSQLRSERELAAERVRELRDEAERHYVERQSAPAQAEPVVERTIVTPQPYVDSGVHEEVQALSRRVDALAIAAPAVEKQVDAQPRIAVAEQAKLAPLEAALRQANERSAELGALTEQAQTDASNAQLQAEAATARAVRLESERRALQEWNATLIPEGILLTLGAAFDSNATTLRGDSVASLERLAGFLADRPDRRVQVTGHTDSGGAAEYNRALSERRAQAVRDALTKRGAEPGLIVAEGKGESEPVASNATRDGRASNRRVEVLIYDASAPELPAVPMT